MMKRVTTVGLVLVLAALVPAWSTAAQVQHPSELKYPELKVEAPEYEEIEFENGLRGFFIEDHEVPIVNIHMRVSTERPPEEKTGLNRLGAWAIRNGGSVEWPADRINDELEFVAAGLEIWGSGRSALINVNCLKKDLELCLEILADLLRSPAFPEEQIELGRTSMIENIRRQNDDPRRVASREFERVLYADHPMAWTATEASMSAVTRDDLVEYHRTYFRPNNTLIGISGDVTKQEITGLLNEALAGWEPADVAIAPEPKLPLTFEPSVNYVYKDIHQGVIQVGHLGLNSMDENRPAVEIMSFILGDSGFTSRIMQRVRSDEGLAYAAYSYFTDDPWNYGVFAASSQTRADATARATSLILEIIRDMRDAGPTEDEVERAIDSYLNSRVFDYDSKRRMVERLVRLEWEGRPLDTPERDIERIGSLTVDDIRAAAAEYLHPDGLVILVVGNEEAFDQPLSNFGDVNIIELEE
jgi:zinc protease